ncbi:T9SS type B sorting domain-containing protein [Mariniflexile sp. HNIBRBA6329]|uniref:T9SS type B sorting domain-containing protein n=1 Tax=Mariniflexile sp. HNIBRBA6329 TaxID=3373088 RepID=UPI003745CFCC
MNKTTYIKSAFIVVLLLNFYSYAQTYKPFTVREKVDVRGSMLVIGNNILSKDNLPVNDNVSVNQSINMQYVDIDGDASTFSSSSADLILSDHKDGSATTCYRVAYAGLYWSAMLKSGESRANITNIKLKLPGNSTYVNIGGEIIYDAIVSPIVSFNNEPGNTPYACYADITNIISGLSDIEGTYTVADIVSSQGFNNSTGLSAGWSLIVIYEDPELHTKSFTLFDGFSHLFNGQQLVIPVTGFRTPPAGNIDLQFAYGVLEGDKTQKSKLEINGKEVLTPLRKPANNFFRSIIENTNGVSHPRNPMSENTLGYDTGFLEIIKANPSYINNNVTSADFRLQVPLGQADPIFAFFSAFAVDIIAPDIDLTKVVLDTSGNDIDGDDVNLGQNLFYEISYQSVGNDNVTQFTIKDVLPDNIVFDPSTDIDLTNAGGATLQSYDPVTRTLIFNIPDASVEVNDPRFVIRIAVQVVPNCYDLSQACSNEIMNQAFATYRGVINPTVIQDEGSFATTECLGVPGSTNFLVDISNCSFEKNEVLCGPSVLLKAADGYDSYSWSTSPTGTPVIGTGQTYTATNTGTYYVNNTTSSTCISIQEKITVIPYGSTITNPVIPYADKVVICPNDGKQLPYIFLCGINDTRAITTGISDAVSIIWQKLDEGSCSALTIDDCANESPDCTWNQVATGPNYTATESGQFRIVINYPGGCFSIFYFNVYQNLLNPTATAKDIICTTPGEITVGGVPSGYEYSVDGTNYQSSNVFTINTPGYYIIYIRQVGVDTNPCIFQTPSVYVRQRDFTVTTFVTQPNCNGDKGSIKLASNDALPQYYYSISQGGTLVNSVGPILASDYTFPNLNPGIYTYTVSTDDGCTFSDDLEIINPPVLTATSAVTRPLTCTDGEITVYPNGGTPPYLYYVNGSTDSQDSPIIIAPSSGNYTILVVDSNNCSTTTSQYIEGIPAPTYSLSSTDILCYGDNFGEIQFNVTNANGYAITYSIDNGVTYSPNPTFSNLGAGTYSTSIKYSLNGIECFSSVQDITITQPDSAVTASGGVSELAGCGPSGEGKVRITNPQGGTPPYEYSFDNQATWVTTNEAYVAPGTYTLYIRDANGCIYAMPGIVLDPEPVAPTIDVSDPDFNCDGTANATVTVTNSGSNTYTYGYLLDGVENTNTADPKTFLDVSQGSHTISVTYKLETVPTYSNLLFEDFGSGGDVTSPGINPNFCFERQVEATKCNGDKLFGNGEYTVTNELRNNPYDGWWSPVDHTSGSIPGRFLAVDAGFAIPNNAVVYRKHIVDIIPNQPIQVRFFATNLLKVGNTQPDASLTVELQDVNGAALSSESTGGIPKTNGWVEFNKTINPGNNTTLDFVLRLEIAQVNGIDFAVDDIEVYQLPKTCIEQVDFPFIVGSGNAFTADITATDIGCNGGADGTITISAQNFDPSKGFQYSIDNGATWNTQMTSPYTITGLAASSYTVIVRYEDAVDTCSLTFNQDITAPTVLGVTASGTPVTCLDGSTVTVTATGGSPAYAYELLDTSLNLVANFPSNGILTNVSAGDYTIRATDANGCTATTTISLQNPNPPTASIINADYCYDAVNGATLEVSASGGQTPYEYSINGSAFQSNPIFTNLTPGSYVITVRDAYGCEVILPAETIATQVSVDVTLVKELDCTSNPDAVITGTISDGYSPYTVTLIQGTGTINLTGNSFTLTTSVDGDYQFQVTDANGCQIVSNVITISPIINPTATTTTVNPSCNGDSNGSVQIIPASGVGPYMFSFNGSTFTTTSLYTGLAAGTYPYQVQDANECIFNGTVTLTEPTALVVSANATAFMCSASNTAQSAIVTIDVPTTGTAPYLYSFNGSGYSSTNTLTVNDNGTDQVITYSVQDANGCTNSGSLTIFRLDPPTDLDFAATDITCLATSSTVTLTATNGVGPLQYETIAPSPIVIGKQTSNIFTGLTPGTYIFRVTDANGCYYTESYNVNPVTPIAVTGLKLSDVLCNGDTTGAIQFTVYDSTGFTYTINSGASIAGTSPINLSGLTAGSYTIVVTDTTTGCSANETITISEPANPISLTATATNVHCNNFNSQITAIVSGGTPNYTYAAVISGATAPTAFDYSSNNVITVDTNSAVDLIWDVYVKDANGCISITTVTVIQDPLPTVTAPTVSNQCTSTSGFTFTVSGTGVAPLSYSINGGASYQTSPTFTVNAAGSFTITIKDGNGCTATSATQTDVFAPIMVSADLTKDLTCYAPAEATIDGTISGGNAPYTISTIQGSGTATVSGSTFTFLTSVAGDYQFEITDANGCTQQTNVITVTYTVNPVILSVSPVQDILCNGEETAAINVNIDTNFGFPPFVINVHNDTTGTDYGTQTSGLAAGNYTITVTDARGCTDTETIAIGEPNVIDFDLANVDITCSALGGSSLGSITIENVTGGTAPFTYYITNNFGDLIAGNPYSATSNEDHTFNIINFGIYTINVIDVNGCSLTKQIIMASPPSDLSIDVTTVSSDCINGGTASVEAISAVGSGNYEFGILEFNSAPYTSTFVGPDVPGGSIKTFTNLTPGVVYTFVVHDLSTDCYFVKSADSPIAPASTLTSSVIPNNITCLGENDGSVTFTIDGFDSTTTSVDYEIFTAYNNISLGASVNVPVTFGTPETITAPSPGTLSAGQYYIVFTENGTGSYNGCKSASAIFEIKESTIDLTISASVSRNENCNELGVITAIASNGTAPYTYQLLLSTDPAPTATDAGWVSSNTFTASAGDYIVYVKDAYGCIKLDPVSLIKDPEPTINPVASQCFDGTPFTITLVEGTGVAISPLTYSIGGAYQSSPTFTINSAGTYTVSVKDANGCIASDSYVVQPPLLLDVDLTQDLTCLVDASITLTASGGTGVYNTYEVSFNGGVYGPASTPYIAILDGTYQFRVTDDQGCQAFSNVITVTPKTTPTFTYTQTNVSCNGGADGSIVITAADGIVPYQYSIDNGANFQSSNVFTGLSQGTYDVIVRDSKNCDSAATQVTITEPTVVGGTGDLTQGLTCGSGNATQPAIITITGSGGTAPYTYSFNGGVNYTSINTYSTYASGTVTAYVKDANGCIIVTPIDVLVPALDEPTDLDFVSTPVTCLAVTSDVTLTATNGVAPLSYEIISPITVGPQASNVFTGLAPDTYVFTVTDANGCYYTESFTVVPVTNITVSGLLVSDVNCNGGTDGAVEFTVSNFGSTYSYTINGSSAITGQTSNTINLTGLSIGDQTIIVTDETTGCTDIVTVTVNEPALLTLVEASNTNANCNFGAQVTVTANGGTSPYQYAFVVNGSVPSISNYTSRSSAILDPATSLDWDVWVMDSNGCTDQIDVVIATDPLPTVTVPTLASNQCNLTGDPYTFTVTGTTGIAPFTYSIGNGFQSSPTFTVSTPGTYFVTVRDGNGCTNVSGTSITIYPALDLSASVTALPSCFDNDGVITVTGAGGSGSYAYSISPVVGLVSGNVISGVPSGTYTVTITDTVTLCTKDIDVTLDAATPVTFTTTPIDVSCNGSSDGAITVNLDASNDNPIYTYEIIAPIAVAPQTSNVFTGLAAGTYTVQVTSGRNCVATEDVVVGEPNIITVPAPTVVDYACTAGTNTTNFASITVSGVTGGSGTYTNYEFIRGGTTVQFGPNNVYTELDFLGGSYIINVYDNKGCLGTTTATIEPYIKLESLDIAIDNAITCTNDEDITVLVTSTGGTPNLEYTLEDFAAILPTQTNNTGVFTALPIGNYIITVTNLDTGCSLQTAHYVNNPNTFDLTIDSVIDVTCFADNNGSVNVTFIDRTPIPTDESGPFNYQIYNVTDLVNPVQTGSTADAGPITINGLASGTYSIIATLINTPFCTVTKNFTITAPTAALSIAETHTEITCVSGNNDGTISASATGGWPGTYEYQLALTSGTVISAYSSEFNFTGLTAGDYTVSVIDSKGCVATVNVVLTNPLPIDAIATPSTNLLSCFGDKNATITVSNVTGGQQSNYTYTLNMTAPTVSSSGPQVSPVFSGLGAGTYNVTVTDGYNCAFTTTDVVIAEPTQIEAALVKASTQTCFTDATLTLSATGGTGVYQYSDDASFTNVMGTFTSNVTFSVTPGTYSYYVRDANACTASVSNEITIDPLQPLVVNLDTTNATINCAGDATGVIVATAQGGLGSYVYTLQDGSGTDIPGAVQNSPGVFTELPIGTYQVQVTSIDCDATSLSVIITEPSLPLTAQLTITDIVCNGSNDGMVEISASGGTGIIKYAISPQMNQFFDDPVFDNLAPGDYQIIVQDELGCYQLYDVTIVEPDPVVLTIVPNSIFPEACSGDLDGEFSIDISGGNMPYSVSLDDINGVYTTGTATQTQFDFTNLAGGDHIVYIRDAFGCESEWNITFPESVLIEPEVEVVFGCENNISTNTVTVTVDASTLDLNDLDYSLDGGTYQNSNIFSDVPAGTNHIITVRHTNGCEKPTLPFDIEPYTPLALTIDMPTGGTLNEIVATATGGSGDYEFTLNGESYGSTNTFLIYESGTYTVTVTDSYGCFATATQYFEFVDLCIPNYFTPNNDGDLDQWGPGCASQYRNLKVNIFDRYGRKVATLNVNAKWDGKYNGIELPTGDYWYVVKLNDKKYDKEFVGHFTLYR